MAEEKQIKTPTLPPGYVSITVLRERWLQRQKAKQEQEEEEAKKKMECVEDCLDEKKDGVDGVDGIVKEKGKKVVEEVGSGGVEKRGINDDLYGDDGMRINVGGGGLRGLRGFSDRRIGRGGGRFGGDWRRFGGRKERIDLGVNRKVNEGESSGGDRRRFERGLRIGDGEGRGNVVGGRMEGLMGSGGGGDRRGFGRGFGVRMGESEVEDGNVVDGLEGYGNKSIYEGEGVGEDRRRFGRGLGVSMGESEVEDGNVVEGSKGYGNKWIYEGEGVGGGGRGFGSGLGVRMGESEVKMKNVVDTREENVKVLKGYENRRINDAVDVAGVIRDLEISGEKKGGGKYGGSSESRGFERENGGVKRYVVDVREGKVVDIKLLGDLGEMRVNEVEIGGKFKDLVETQVNEEVEIGGKVKVLGETRVTEEVEIGGKFRDWRTGGDKYGRDRRNFGKVFGIEKKENVVGKNRNVADVRAGSEVVKGNVVDVREENTVDGKMLEVSKGFGDRIINEAVDIGRKFGDLKINGGGKRGKFRYGRERRKFRPRKEKISVAVRRENEVEKRNLVDVKEKNDVEKQIPVPVQDENEVKKLNLVDVKMAESSKVFGPRRGNEAIGGKFGGLSNNGLKGDNFKYGRGRGRFGSWTKKNEESGLIWVKKADAEADTQAQVETPDVK